MYRILLIILALSASSAMADSAAPSDHFFFCPMPQELEKEPVKKTWSAQRLQWRSYEISFVDKVTKFLGAQWVGANVGQLTCVYSGDDPKEFPILLIFSTLVYSPETDKWSKDLGGFRNCKTDDPQHCPFKPRMQNRPEDINLQLEQLKNLPATPRE